MVTCAKGITPFLKEELLHLGFPVHVILAAGWKGSSHFINPMCGSGTLDIEAACIALNRASGILRDNCGFMHLRGFKESLWNDLRARAKKEAKKTLGCRIIAADIRREAVESATKDSIL